jgi:UDP:flavonoid glycosyltransferase YjiC (YdhE family)
MTRKLKIPRKPSKQSLIQFVLYNFGGVAFFVIGYLVFVVLYGLLSWHWIIDNVFDDLTGWYRQARLAVARAGATTLAEMACAGCPAVLIPYPNSLGDHQVRNACWYAAGGAARVVRQQRDAAETARLLAEELASLLGDGELCGRMSDTMRSLARPHAAAEAADRICAFVSGTSWRAAAWKPQSFARAM